MNKNHANNAGFTLIELIVVITILSVLVMLAVPSFSQLADKRRLTGAAENLAASLQLVRLEAIKRNSPISVSFSADSSATWCYGLDETTGCNCDLVDPTNANACALPVSGVQSLFATTTNTAVTPNESDNYRDITMDAPSFGGNAFTTFDNVRGTTTAGTVTLTSKFGKVMKVVISGLGRVRLCTPSTTSENVPGYSSESC